MKKYLKQFLGTVFSIFIFIFLLELFSRGAVYLITKNNVIFQYGFNKTILFKVADLSNLDLILISEEKKKSKIKKKNIKTKKKFIIWTFGGSTTEGNWANCGHETSNWPKELSNLNENITVINYGVTGRSTQDSIEYLIDALAEWKTKSKSLEEENTKPDLILWAHKYNEYDNYSDNDKILSKNNIIHFIQRVDLTFKSNLVFYFLTNDVAERVRYKLFGHKNKFQLNDKIQVLHDINHVNGVDGKEFKRRSDKNYQLSADIYEQRTIRAFNYAQNFNIDFHIISLFGSEHNKPLTLPGNYVHSNLDDSKPETFFYNPRFYDYWFKVVEKISDNHNINYLKTEKFAKDIIEMNYLNETKKGSQFFCDRIHQSLKGNILTAKIINNYLLNYYDNYLKKAFIN
jgi:hypothetical protein|tara:strand:+ start:5003 stop:6205 length:1203 start_codon:yes stop_codon:yes gene_type:complete